MNIKAVKARQTRFKWVTMILFMCFAFMSGIFAVQNGNVANAGFDISNPDAYDKVSLDYGQKVLIAGKNDGSSKIEELTSSFSGHNFAFIKDVNKESYGELSSGSIKAINGTLRSVVNIEPNSTLYRSLSGNYGFTANVYIRVKAQLDENSTPFSINVTQNGATLLSIANGTTGDDLYSQTSELILNGLTPITINISPNDGKAITLYHAELTVTPELSSASATMQTSANITVSGENRRLTTYSTDAQNTLAVVLSRIHLKANDKIIIDIGSYNLSVAGKTVDLISNQNITDFASIYRDAFAPFYQSSIATPIMWEVLNDNLIRIAPDKANDGTLSQAKLNIGQTAVFTVSKDVTAETTAINTEAFLPTAVEYNSGANNPYTINKSGFINDRAMTINIDCTKPLRPTLSSSNLFYELMMSGNYYTTTNRIGFAFDVNWSTVQSAENIWMKTAPAGYDLTAPDFKNDGDGKFLAFTASSISGSTTNQYTFDDSNNKRFQLSFVSIDDAGNISEELKFDGNNSNEPLFLLDSSSYTFLSKILIAGTASGNEIAGTTYMITGTPDQNGGVTASSKRVSVSVKRGVTITFRFIFTDSQLLNYSFTQIRGYSNMSESQIKANIKQGANSKYFDYTVKADGENLSQLYREIDFVFKEKIDILIESSPITFDPNVNFRNLDDKLTFQNRRGDTLQDISLSEKSYTDSSGQTSQNGFKFAGKYKYSFKVSNEKYFAEKTGDWEIRKASPDVRALTQTGTLFFDAEGEFWNNIRFNMQLSNGSLDSGSLVDNHIIYTTYAGVKGTIEILNLTVQDNRSGVITKTIRFKPEDAKPSNSADGRNTENYQDFDITNVSITVQANNLTSLLKIGSNLVIYNSYSQTPTLSFNTDDINIKNLIDLLEISYAPEGSTIFTATAPNNAGKYQVKVLLRTDGDVNKGYVVDTTFTGENAFSIAEKTLLIDAYDVDGHLISLSDSFTYMYGRFTMPTCEAYYFDTAIKTTVNVQMGVFYKKDGSSTFTQFNFLESEYFNSLLALGVGTYEIKFEVGRESTSIKNYQGLITRKLIITKAMIDNSQSFRVDFPTFINGANLPYGSSIYYGQALNAAGLQGGNATFTYASSTAAQKVDGTFAVRDGSRILDAGSHDVIVDFLPSNDNFAVISSDSTIMNIAKATPTFTNIVLSDIEYGSLLAVSQNDLPHHIGTPSLSDGNLQLLTQFNTILAKGTHQVQFKFIPSSLHIKNYNVVESFYLTINVVSKRAYIEAVSGFEKEYGFSLINPTIKTYHLKGEEKIYETISVTFQYFDKTDTEMSHPIIIGATSSVGAYTVRMLINNTNYEGSEVFDFSIIKGNLKTQALPSASLIFGDIEYGEVLGNIILQDGQCFIEGTTISNIRGTFRFKNASEQTKVGINKYTVIFTPNDMVNLNEFEFDYEMRGEKKTVNVTVNDSETDTEFSKYYDGQKFVIKGKAFGFLDENKVLDISIDYITDDKSAPTKAGIYQVDVSVSDSHYRGVKIIVAKILKREISVDTAIQTKAYSGSLITADIKLTDDSGLFTDLSALKYTVTYKGYNGLLKDPIDVGRYNVDIELTEENFTGKTTISLYVAPSKMDILHLSQVYGNTTAVTLDSLPSDINYKVDYKAIGGEFTVLIPTEAGKYIVRINIDHFGYKKIIETPIENCLVIAKAKADIIISDKYDMTYTSKNHNLSINVNPLDILQSYYYRLHSSDNVNIPLDQANETILLANGFTKISPIDVGKYDVVLIAENVNFRGVAKTTLNIIKAELRIEVAPVLDNVIEFSTLPKDVLFKANSGIVKFPGNTDMTIYGYYEIVDDISSYFVGIHDNISYRFISTKSQVDNTPNPNFNPINGKLKITIVKKDISDYLIFNNGEFKQKYDQGSKSVSVSLSKDLPLPSGYPDIFIRLFYADGDALPINVGSYSVKALIDDRNFSGSLSSIDPLVIERADLTVIAPTVSAINKGQTAGNVTLSGGEAFIGGTQKSVAGKFLIYDTNILYTQANYRDLALQFIPTETNNYNIANIVIKVWVVGTAVTVSNIVTENIKYGQPLSNSVITGAATTDGKFVWTNPDKIADVNGIHEFEFIPTNADDFNIEKGNLSGFINKGEMSVVSYTATAFVGEKLSSLVFTADVVNIDVQNLKVSFDVMFNGTDRLVSESDLQNGITTSIILKNINYNDLTITEIKVKVFRKILAEDIVVGQSSAFYSGNAISVADLQISVNNTNFAIENFAIRFFQNGSELQNIINKGVYDILITAIDEQGEYAGNKTIKFEILKRDISSEIGLVNNSKTYGEQGSPKATFGLFENVVEAGTVVYNFMTKDGALNFGAIVPQDAGEYAVKVTIPYSNQFVEGTHQFIYTIKKAKATVTLQSSTQTYGSVNAVVPTFIDSSLSSGDYYVTYKGVQSLPETVGDYALSVVITHKNFDSEANLGGTTAILRIIAAKLSLGDKSVSLSNIAYDQTYGESIITPCDVYFGNNMQNIVGRFEIENRLSKPSRAGDHNVNVIFYPDNSNFEALNITAVLTVDKANASISGSGESAFEKTYNGHAQLPNLVVQPNGNVRLHYSFKKDGQTVSEAKGAGVYSVNVNVEDTNYSGSAEFSFTIKKAKATEVHAPKVSDLEYGKSLQNSLFREGSVVYIVGNSAVGGTFTYVNPARVLGDVMLYNNIDYKFVPNDTANYEEYNGKINVNVVQATAEIFATGTNFSFGETILKDRIHLTTKPSGLTCVIDASADNDIFNRNNLNAGTYGTYVQINDRNYKGRIPLLITVDKKQVNIEYKDNNENILSRYLLSYNEKFRITPSIVQIDGLSQDQIDDINDRLILKFKKRDVEGALFDYKVPTGVGEYIIGLDLNHINFALSKDSVQIPFDIVRAEIEAIDFDGDSLGMQVYGSVAYPVINVRPSGVNYVVRFEGYQNMPTMAGVYNVKVIISDPNYLPTEESAVFRILKKEITIEEIKAKDKSFDGVSTITVNGELKGILLGDEVKLTMKGNTFDNNATIGNHKLVITSWEITGLHAANYILKEPLYDIYVKVKGQNIVDKSTGSYLTSPDGISQSLAMVVSEVKNTNVKNGVFAWMFGQTAQSYSIEIRDLGQTVTLDTKVKFYIKIPDKFLNAKNLKLYGAGKLGDRNITFTKEQDYYTFWADSSGEVIFQESNFPYWIIMVGGAVLIILLGMMTFKLLDPMHKNKKIKRQVRKQMEKR